MPCQVPGTDPALPPRLGMLREEKLGRQMDREGQEKQHNADGFGEPGKGREGLSLLLEALSVALCSPQLLWRG